MPETIVIHFFSLYRPPMKPTLTSGLALKPILKPTPRYYAGRCWGCKHQQGGVPQVRVPCTVHPSRLFLTLVLHDEKDGNGRKAKERLVNSGRPLPLIAFGSFSRRSKKVRRPKSQQAAAIINADWTGRRAGFLPKLRPRETCEWDCVKTGRWIVRRRSCECCWRQFYAKSKVAFYELSFLKASSCAFQRMLHYKMPGGKKNIFYNIFYFSFFLVLSWKNWNRLLSWTLQVCFTWRFCRDLWQLQTTFQNGRLAKQSFRSKSIKKKNRLTRAESQQWHKVGVTFCLSYMVIRVLLISSKLPADSCHVQMKRSFTRYFLSHGGVCLHARRCLAKSSSTAAHYVSEQPNDVDSLRKTKCKP